jgi:hypothetical protein
LLQLVLAKEPRGNKGRAKERGTEARPSALPEPKLFGVIGV